MKCLVEKCWHEVIPGLEYCRECAEKQPKKHWSIAQMQIYVKEVMGQRQHERDMNDPEVKKVTEALL